MRLCVYRNANTHSDGSNIFLALSLFWEVFMHNVYCLPSSGSFIIHRNLNKSMNCFCCCYHIVGPAFDWTGYILYTVAPLYSLFSLFWYLISTFSETHALYLHDFVHCTAATRQADWIIAWMSRWPVSVCTLLTTFTYLSD